MSEAVCPVCFGMFRSCPKCHGEGVIPRGRLLSVCDFCQGSVCTCNRKRA